jgi:hypothetical protein
MGKSTLANKVYTEMKTMEVFSKGASEYVTFDLDSDSSNSAKIDEIERWLAHQLGPVLLLLDNVQHQHQVDSIMNDSNIKANSFVLVTSRKQGLVSPSDRYDMPPMADSDAFKLFRWHSQGPSSDGALKQGSLKVCIMITE